MTTTKLIILLSIIFIIATIIAIISIIAYNKLKKKYQAKQRKYIKSESKMSRTAPFLMWLIEFSKKVVILCVILYTVVILYSAIVMWISKDFYALPTLISESSDVLRTCVFGYMIKAGIENWQKIKRSSNIISEDENNDEAKG